MALPAKVQRKFWNIIKVFRQIRGTIDTFDGLLQAKASGKVIGQKQLINSFNRLLLLWEAGFTVDDLND